MVSLTVMVAAACSKDEATVTTTSLRTPPATASTTSVAASSSTTTTAEPEPVKALRAYFDAYARAVQTKDPDAILPFLNRENSDIVRAVRDAVENDIRLGDSGRADVTAAAIEFDRANSSCQR